MKEGLKVRLTCMYVCVLCRVCVCVCVCVNVYIHKFAIIVYIRSCVSDSICMCVELAVFCVWN